MRTVELGRFDFAEAREMWLFETFGDPLFEVSLCTEGDSGAVVLWSTGWVGPHENIAPYWLRCTRDRCDEVAPLW